MNKLPLAVIFDTDDTLYNYEIAHSAGMKILEEKVKDVLGVEKKNFNEHFQKSRNEVKKQLGKTASSHSRLLYIQKTLESLGMKTQIQLSLDLEKLYWRTYLNNSKLFINVLEFINLLKNKEIIIVNITDLTAEIQFRKLVYFGLDKYFDYVVTSEESGEDKPGAKSFKMALEKIQINPERIWMIGDSAKKDMVGAGRMGMIKIQKKHQGVKIYENGEEKPDLIFENYNDLIEIINKFV